ncbi:Gfo/Idh/MocA family protein [Arenicella xantha]|uniref:D-galactose 1-dehydrogenase n=1 Tax=Arenicella xantha TaxID=644221 RepID=A0A395JPL6_9GAMM|nr:Gfo/Idh/MocA family oxidoreductase [Arenicella xantha]RBP51518.1 D-galactose 1-dehydrogenase [Arenicella xantha]
MQSKPINLGIVGVGKIVQDQHLPSIRSNSDFHLLATASRNGVVPGVAAYKTIEAMVAAEPELHAVALCMPPQYRFAAAQVALQHGLHVLLEKPPGATVSEVNELVALANGKGLSLYATWHSRHGSAVSVAKQRLASSVVQSVKLTWKEDVRKWHPGQDWIWQAGGLGVFDPGINGLSILTDVLSESMFVSSAHLEFPENRAAPIAASINFISASGKRIPAEFDWRQTGDEVWDIEFITSDGLIKISHGGGSLSVDGQLVELPESSEYCEYQAIYARFSELIQQAQSDVDLRPLQLVADAFMLAERSTVAAFTG